MIQLSATREDTEPHRIQRLIRVLAKVNREEIGDYVAKLNDHKGLLSVDYKKRPIDISLTTAFLNAWYEENESAIVFTVQGVPYKDYTGMAYFDS